jgi:hypothetical protein
MKKLFCDICEKECKSVTHLEYMCHIDDMVNGNVGEYVDNDGHAVSGRTVLLELCHRCYNDILVTAVKKAHDLRSKAHAERGRAEHGVYS